VKQDHQQFESAKSAELPAPLPVGERVIWQGKPGFKGLALRSFHIREVAIYFGVLLAWRLWSNWSNGMPARDAAISALWLIAPAISAITVLAALAWLFRRAACYTITSKRVLFQFGVALPMTMNVPLSKITNAALKIHRDGSGDIPLGVFDSKRVSYLLLWPHIRPWRLREPEPMLCALPDAAIVAAKLSEALGGQPAPAAVALSAAANRNLLSGATANSPSTAAA
jgi:hypothetical protein